MADGAEPGDWERSERGGRAGLVALILLAVAGVAGGLAVATDSGPAELVVEETTEPVQEEALGVVDELPPAPLSPRSAMAHAWTGEELIVWGGISLAVAQAQQPSPDETENPPTEIPPIEGLRGNGAAFNPSENSWRLLPSFEAPPRRVNEVYAWAGDRLLVWGGIDRDRLPLTDGAAYIPAEDRWEQLPPAPIDGRVFATSVWTGEELIVLGGSVPRDDGSGEPQSDGVAFNPTMGQWRMLPPPPDPPPGVAPDGFVLSPVVWTGERLVIWQGTAGAAYHPDRDQWEMLEPPVRVRRTGETVVVALDDDRIAVLGVRPENSPPGTSGIIYDLTRDRAEEIPPGWPAWQQGFGAQSFVVGDTVVIMPGFPPGPEEGQEPPAPVAWDTRTGLWSELPENVSQRGLAASAWTGEELLVWGGFDGRADRNDGIRWRPTEEP